jgi:nicotinamide-nucleotide adenylyltransferase
LAGENWEELVPKSVAKYLRQIGGDERMREISQSDKLA